MFILLIGGWLICLCFDTDKGGGFPVLPKEIMQLPEMPRDIWKISNPDVFFHRRGRTVGRVQLSILGKGNKNDYPTGFE